VDERREQRRTMRSHMRKSSCYKATYSRKQALTQANTLLKRGIAKYVRPYKCRTCGYFHMTSQPPRFSPGQDKKRDMK
jgi:predicted Zn-ribbon and HTH transcriptional regulator